MIGEYSWPLNCCRHLASTGVTWSLSGNGARRQAVRLRAASPPNKFFLFCLRVAILPFPTERRVSSTPPLTQQERLTGQGSSCSLQPSCLDSLVSPENSNSLIICPSAPINLITCVYNLFQLKVKELWLRQRWMRIVHIFPRILGLFKGAWEACLRRRTNKVLRVWKGGRAHVWLLGTSWDYEEEGFGEGLERWGEFA